MRGLSLFCLWAQAEPTVTGATPGWTAAGLLFLFVNWLLWKEIPEKNSIIRDTIARHEQTEQRQRDTHSALEREQRLEFQTALKIIVDHCHDELTDLKRSIWPPKDQ